MRRLLYIALMFCLLAACSDDARIAAVLSRVDSLMSGRPDSALTLLDSALHSGAGTEHQQAQLRLRRLNAINKLDTVFTTARIAQAQALADHFDRQGTPNERMLAHYLLGRTYADDGQAPQAIQSYQEAADCADTTSADCDYRQLCFVYSQMGDLFYHQNLYQESLHSLNKAISFGYQAKDTLHALLANALKVHVYSMLSNKDSVLILSEMTSERFRKSGYKHEAASILSIQIRILVERGDYEKARNYIDIYERESGFFNNNDIALGREVFYYAKGFYFLKTSQYDSAEYYFRKELATGKDFNNQNAGSRGLALLYQQINRPDSAAKYALYSYAMNDSVYDQEAVEEVAKAKALYDYSLFERKAQQEKNRADRERTFNIIILFLSVTMVAFGMYAFYHHRKKYRKEYQQVITKLGEAQNNILLLKAHETTLYSTIAEKLEQQSKVEDMKSELTILKSTIKERELEIERQREILSKFQQKEKLTKVSTDNLINQSNTYKRIRTIANQGQLLTDDDWNHLMQLVIQHLPGFYNLLSARERHLTRIEYQICILERLDIEPRRMHYLLGISESYVSRIRDGLHLKVFGTGGSRQLFSKEIKTFC